MSDEQASDDELQPSRPEGIVMAQEPGVRVFWLTAADVQGLVDRLALVLSEHMASGDELHVTYKAMQAGWQEHPPTRGWFVRSPKQGWTELMIEYSAFVILRGHT
jgi:hypothetical protein